VCQERRAEDKCQLNVIDLARLNGLSFLLQRSSRMTPKPSLKTIDDYIATLPRKIQAILKKIRLTIRKAAPDAEEKISYRMPVFFHGGVVIYFAAFKNHIGIFPPVHGDEKLDKQLARYRGPKGNLKFPLNEPVPYNLISRIVKLRMKQNGERTKSAAQRRKRLAGTSPRNRVAAPFAIRSERE
jgi:uncharacterized protein YdhG (YjbR/CyaY superfamily)